MRYNELLWMDDARRNVMSVLKFYYDDYETVSETMDFVDRMWNMKDGDTIYYDNFSIKVTCQEWATFSKYCIERI